MARPSVAAVSVGQATHEGPVVTVMEVPSILYGVCFAPLVLVPLAVFCAACPAVYSYFSEVKFAQACVEVPEDVVGPRVLALVFLAPRLLGAPHVGPRLSGEALGDAAPERVGVLADGVPRLVRYVLDVVHPLRTPLHVRGAGALLQAVTATRALVVSRSPTVVCCGGVPVPQSFRRPLPLLGPRPVQGMVALVRLWVLVTQFWLLTLYLEVAPKSGLLALLVAVPVVPP